MKRKGIVVVVSAMLLSTVGIASGTSAVDRAPEVGEDGRRGDPSQLEAATGQRAVSGIDKIKPGSEERVYLIRLTDAAVPTYEGGKDGFPATQPDAGQRLDPDSGRVLRYADFLREEQAEFIERINRTTGRQVDVVFQYEHAVNGVAVRLTGDEALMIANDRSVVSIQPDVQRELHTDQGPEFIGADDVWAGVGLPEGYEGEGMVIGVIDTGISPNNPSFLDPAPGDGYDHTNPRGADNYVGVCNNDPTELNEHVAYDAGFPCNDKLIGAWVYDVGSALPTGQTWDYDGHGSHTASTAGGNRVADVDIQSTPFDISGVAPRANVIAYLGCCSLSGLTASIDQAIEDEVDVINYSIGSSASTSGWDEFDALGFLNARAAGIFVATSNGNDGPGLYTGGSPADVPWVTSVANQTHTRYNGNTLVDMTGGDTTPPADILGKGATAGLALTDIVYAGDVGDPMCLNLAPGQPIPPADEGTPGNPVDDYSAEWTGKIVVCDRGMNGRVQKSRNAAAHGAVGFVLVNDPASGNSLVGDEYVIPGVMVGSADGEVLKAWLASGVGHQAAIAGFEFLFGPQYADFISATSSRGPNRFVDVLNPSVSAPGTDILAALVDHDAPANEYGGVEYGMISGTSMASPHVAGAGALLMQAHPEWSPAQIQSALMTTASPTVQHHNGGNGVDPAPAVGTPDVQGSGRVQVGLAANAGLLFHETPQNYEAADPLAGGDPKELNVPSFMNSQCLVECGWTRTATVPADAGSNVPSGVTWSASVVTDTGLTLDVQLSAATLSPGDSTTIAVDADVAGAEDGVPLYGRITLTPSDAAVPPVTMPVLVVPSSAVLPAELDIATRRNTGSQEISGVQSQEVTDLSGTTAWVLPEITEDTAVEDPTSGDPYDDLAQVDVHTFEVPEGAAAAVFEILATDMVDLDMFVGTGTAASAATEIASSATGSALERVLLTNPEPGTYWVLIQNWDSATAGVEVPYTLATAMVPGADNGTGELITPTGTVPTGEVYSLTATWNLPSMVEGDIAYGAAVLGGAPGAAGHIGTVPITLHREADDVTKSASTTTGVSGDTIDYTIDIQPNVTDTDLTYTIVDTVPAGLTIDGTTVAGELDGQPITGVVDGQTITWEVTMPSPFLGEFSYEMTTPTDNPNCGNVFGTFVDIGPEGGPPNLSYALDGDTDAGLFFGANAPLLYGQSHGGLVVTEDGLITVPDGYAGDPWTPQAIPDSLFPNGVIAPMWSDLEASNADGSGVVVATNGPEMMIVQWDNLFEYTDDDSVGPSVGKFQAIMFNYVDPTWPEIQFEYGAAGDLPAAATIGLENLAGDTAVAHTSVADPTEAFADGVVCFDWVGPEFPPATLSYGVTVDEPVAAGTYTNVVSHVTDDIADAPAQATAEVWIDAPAIQLDPPVTYFDQIEIGDTADAQVVTVTNSGSADLEVSGATASAGYAVDAAACVAASPLAPGESCGLSVTFSPTMIGLIEGGIAVQGNSVDSPATATLLGVGVAPGLAVSPIEGAQFGQVIVGQTASETISLVNSGNADLTISALTAVEPFTIVEETCMAAVLPPDGACQATIEFAPIDVGSVLGALTVESDAIGAPHDVVLAGEGVQDAPLVPVEPGRYWDTRLGEPTLDGLFAGTGRMSAGSTFAVQITGRGDVPVGATGVVANVTVITPGGPGFATLHPCVGTLPVASHLNYLPGEVWANNAIVPLNDDGQVCVFTKADADFALDVNGFVPAGSGLTGITPARYLDTRPAPNDTFDGDASLDGQVAAEGVVEVQIAGRGDVPADAVAALVNVTAVGPAGHGYLTVFPCVDRPHASTLNYLPGQAVPNGAFAELSEDGTLCVFTKAASDIIVDVTGYVPAGVDGLSAIAPERFLDTRPGQPLIDGTSTSVPGRLAAEQSIEIPIVGRGSVPEGATAVFFNIGVIEPDGPGFAQLYPCGDRPQTSNVNHATAGGVRANNALTVLSDAGSVCLFTKAGADVILDVTGWID